MLKIGLTGGIGCGKSTVAEIFGKFKIPVIDADEIAHRLVAIGQPALAQIQRKFGTDALNPDGSLNRELLRELIFSDGKQKQKLEAILHPLVYQTIQAEVKRLDAPYCIICIPLLFETNMAHLVDRTLVVDCSIETQIERLKKRDNMTVERIQSIIDSQVSRDFRKAHANDLIDNSETNDRLAEAVKKLHNFYLSLSTCQDKLVCE
ncbi:MAG: dephospho-CoA kinase [Methylococcales bacterium]|nr:dephospho-CoA kinase [Methylococcales bacterium]MDD5631647.1 dephospho-CoA kinase [Methylococcales bacterium]